MAVLTQHAPGTFCWPEIATLDQSAAKKFYGTLFGWAFRDMPMGPDGDYTIFTKNGKDAAALFTITKQMRSQGVPPHWGAYVAVANADESAKRAEQLGAKLIMPPFDVMDTVGRMAVIEDPTGAIVSLWQAKNSIGAGILDEVGALCWTELMTRDTAKAATFYSQLFNWKLAEMSMGPMVYTLFKRADGTPAAGMMAMPPEAQAPPNWLSYIQVENCDATTAQAKAMGASVFVAPKDIPGTGRFAVLADPQGATFAILQAERMA